MTKLGPLLTLLGVAALLVCAVPARAQTTHPVHPYYSNARAQIGKDPPIPITFDPPPYGRARALPGATVMQGTGPTPSIVITRPILWAPLITKNIGVWKSNHLVFQLQTSLIVEWPRYVGGPTIPVPPVSSGNPVVLEKGGRTGPQTVTWCPGLPLPTASYNPSCAFPRPTTDPRTATIELAAALRYRGSLHQFGGLGQAQVLGAGAGGRGDIVAAKGGKNPPCKIATSVCIAVFDTIVPANTQAFGGAFGFENTTPGPPAVVPGVFLVNALGPSSAFPGAPGGTITAVGPAITSMSGVTSTGTGAPLPGFTNMATSWGGPWTTGMVTIVTAPSANGFTEQFTLTGSDSSNPANGTRRISLVAGAVSYRSGTGAGYMNANRGWLTLFLPEPAALLGTLGALLALAGCHRLTRRR